MGAELNLGDLGAALNPQEGTVAAYLATPTPPALHRRVATGLFCLGFALLVLAAVSIYMDEREMLQILSAIWELAPYEAVCGCLLIGSCVAILVYSRIRRLPKRDAAVAVKKAALSMLTQCPKSGITSSTRMDVVRMRSLQSRGVVRCWLPYFDIAQEDLVGMKASDFGGADMLIRDGVLYVFESLQAKERWLAGS